LIYTGKGGIFGEELIKPEQTYEYTVVAKSIQVILLGLRADKYSLDD